MFDDQNNDVFTPLQVEEYKAQFRDSGADHTLLDVRTYEEFDEIRIPGTINIPLDELEARAGEVDASKPIIVVCRSGQRSMMGAEILRHAGLQDAAIYNLEGGTLAWRSKGWETETGEAS